MSDQRAPARHAWPTVTVIVPARDERRALPGLLASIETQSHPPDAVIIADGMSRDGTREWLREACTGRPWLTVIDNPAQAIAPALNLAIEAAGTTLVARMDAHATYAEDYLERVLEAFQADDELVAVGGSMRTAGRGAWGKAIATVLSRRFGLGGAGHRVGAASGPVDHAFSPTYRREAVLAAGGFDEQMLANEDFELDHRLRRQGGIVWLAADARCTWFTRESPQATARQMFRYGHYKARTLWLWPESLRARQLAPPLLIIVLLTASVGVRSPQGRRRAAVAWAAYLGACGVLATAAARADGSSPARASLITPIVHLSWGIGLLTGLWTHRRPRTRRRDRAERAPRAHRSVR